MKKLLKILLWIIGIAVLLVVTLPLWIGPVVTIGANLVAPRLTKTNFHLGQFGLNPYSGSLVTGDLQLENPEGFSERCAFTLGKLKVEVEPSTVISEVIHVKLISIKDVFASYINDAQGRNNVDQILANAGLNGEEVEPKAETDDKTLEASEEKKEIKIIIDRLEIEGVVAQLGLLPIPLLPITLVDIGASTGGVTFDQLVVIVSQSLMNALMSAGGNAAALVGALGNDLGKGLSEGIKAIDVKQMEAVGQNLKKVGGNLENVGKDLKGVGKEFESIGKDFLKNITK